MNTNDYGTLDEALTKWAAGHPVWTIEMGGLGPGYEQCIQVGAFEMAKRLKDAPMPDETDAQNKQLDDMLHALCKELEPLSGLSGAQAGAIKSLAYHFVKDGYNETLHQVEQERLIQAARTFPAMAA